MKRLWLLRHAQPLIEAGLCYGRSDVAADANATQLAAQKFKAAFGAGAHALPPVALWTSPLRRCRDLAERVSEDWTHATLTLDPRVQEMDFGVWESHPWRDIPPAAFDAWMADFAHHPFGGEESVQQFMTRVAAAFDEALAWAQHSENKDLIWVTHAGVIRAVTLIAAGTRAVAQARDWPLQAPAYGEWAVFFL